MLPFRFCSNISIFCIPSCMVDEKGIENSITALEHSDRKSEIYFTDVNGPALQKLAFVMNGLHPLLTDIHLASTDQCETFLDGSAPSLQVFVLSGIPFPMLQKFILSATHIVHTIGAVIVVRICCQWSGTCHSDTFHSPPKEWLRGLNSGS